MKLFKNEIYIGDNLTIMQSKNFEKYNNKVDFIYIDPPYNTENNFSYIDNNQNWKNDINSRLIVSKKLLKEDGVIFISIDDNEFATLKDVCNNVFGKTNFIGTLITRQAQRSNAKYINTIHEYIVCYAKNKTKVSHFYVNRLDDPNEGSLIKTVIRKVKREYLKSEVKGYTELKKQIENYISKTGETWIRNYCNIDNEGRIYFAKDLSTPSNPEELIIDEIGLRLPPLKTRGWSSKEKFIRLYKENRLVYKNKRPYEIEYIDECVNHVPSVLNFYSRQGTNDLKKIDLDGLFDTPKPVELIKYLIRIVEHKHNALILDFYAGSGTTAEAVYEINQEDGTAHNYILIQLDEEANKLSKTYKFLKNKGYKNPKISDAMLLRINTFLDKECLDKDYIVYSNNNNIMT